MQNLKVKILIENVDGHDNIGIFLAIISARGTKFDTKVDVHMTFLAKIVTINDGRHNRLPIGIRSARGTKHGMKTFKRKDDLYSHHLYQTIVI